MLDLLPYGIGPPHSRPDAVFQSRKVITCEAQGALTPAIINPVADPVTPAIYGHFAAIGAIGHITALYNEALPPPLQAHSSIELQKTRDLR
jgi:hypothetical protein